MTKKIKLLIFAVTMIGVFIWSIANIAIGISWNNYLEQDIEHNYVVFNGVEYGVGMGSLCFCGRAVAAGAAGLIFTAVSIVVFPKWIEESENEKGLE